MQVVTAYIGIGSNLDDPEAQVRAALEELRALENSDLVRQSSLYRSDPMGPPDQPNYINAVAEIRTGLAAGDLLLRLQAIEQAHGRVRDGERWGPRTLDLDLLVYGDEQIADERLTVPHPGIAERAFVLYPLAEIAPGLRIPGLAPLQDLLNNCAPAGLQRLNGNG